MTDWIAVDWGSSNLRAWRMDGRRGHRRRQRRRPAPSPSTRTPSSPRSSTSSAPGSPTAAAPTSSSAAWPAPAAAGRRRPTPPSPARPAPPPSPGPAPATPASPSASSPASRQDKPADVMRGEETQLAGLLAAEPGFDGVACLPGTHTKWVHLSAGEVVSFASYMTGELFALLATQSVLRKTVGQDGWSEPDFLEAVDETLSRPERMAARLFPLRAEALLHGLAARARPRPPLRPPHRRRARRRPPLLARPRRRPHRRRPPGARLPRRPRPGRPQPPASSTPPP